MRRGGKSAGCQGVSKTRRPKKKKKVGNRFTPAFRIPSLPQLSTMRISGRLADMVPPNSHFFSECGVSLSGGLGTRNGAGKDALGMNQGGRNSGGGCRGVGGSVLASSSAVCPPSHGPKTIIHGRRLEKKRLANAVWRWLFSSVGKSSLVMGAEKKSNFCGALCNALLHVRPRLYRLRRRTV